MTDTNKYPSLRDERGIGQHAEQAESVESLVALRLNLAEQKETAASDAVKYAKEHLADSQKSLEQVTTLRQYWERMMSKLEHPEPATDTVRTLRHVVRDDTAYVDFTNMEGTEVIKDAVKESPVEQARAEEPPQEDLYGHPDTEEAEEEVSLPSRSAQFALVAHPDISLERMHDLFLSVGQNAIWEAGSGGRVEIEPVKDWVYNVPRNMHAFTAWFDLPTHTRPPVKEEDFLNHWHQRFLDALEDMPRVHSDYESGRDINVVNSGGGRSNVWDITARVTLPYGVSPQEFREDLTEAGNKLLVEREGERRGKVDR